MIQRPVCDPDDSHRKSVPVTSGVTPPDPGEGYELIPGHKAFGRVTVDWDWLSTCDNRWAWVPCETKYVGIMAAVKYFRRKIEEK